MLRTKWRHIRSQAPAAPLPGQENVILHDNLSPKWSHTHGVHAPAIFLAQRPGFDPRLCRARGALAPCGASCRDHSHLGPRGRRRQEHRGGQSGPALGAIQAAVRNPINNILKLQCSEEEVQVVAEVISEQGFDELDTLLGEEASKEAVLESLGGTLRH